MARTFSHHHQILASLALSTAVIAFIFLVVDSATSLSLLSLRGVENVDGRQLQVATIVIDPKTIEVATRSPDFIAQAKKATSTNDDDDDNDGCGLIDNRNSPTWIELTQSEVNDAIEVQQCLKRAGEDNDKIKFATAIGRMGLSCSTNISLDIVRSTLSRYDNVWMFGDSIMEQAFHTLACMMDTKSVTTMQSLGKSYKEDGKVIRPTLQFTFGRTNIKYSNHGLHSSGFSEHNLYKYEFPDAVRSSSSKDIIVMNGASAHYDAEYGSRFNKALQFISSQAKLSMAPIYFIEPTPEEWPTTNGMYTPSCPKRDCICEALTDERVMGRGENTAPPPGRPRWIMKDAKFTRLLEVDFFQRRYPHMDPSLLDYNINSCTPNCLPNTWRLDLVRQTFLQNTTYNNSNDVNVIPLYWQLVSNPEGSTGRGAGDCTHRNLYGTEMMIFQWIRTILQLQP